MNDKFHASAKAIIVRDDKVLLIKYDDENEIHYNLPGGKMKPHETAHETMIRKVREEAGGEVGSVGSLAFVYEYIGQNHNYIAGDKHSLSLVFWATLKAGTEPSIDKATEIDPIQIDVSWVPVEELPNIDLWPRINKRLMDLIRLENKKNEIYWGDIL